jgi:hypothetical protein
MTVIYIYIYIYIYISIINLIQQKKERVQVVKKEEKSTDACVLQLQVLFGEQYLMGLLVKLDGDLYRNGRG